MNEWMPSMKQAMFFLNNVTEIKYFEIDFEESSLHKLFHFKTTVTQSQDYLDNSERLRSHVSNFTKTSGCESCVILYPLVLTDLDCTGREKDKKEKWLIQQGIGDIKNEEQYWQYVKTAKPRHGIAAPLDLSNLEAGQTGLSGQLFCFLPLPAKSGVPVHVNGSFVLNSTRQGLWVSPNSSVQDDKSRWNERLMKAVSSSYSDFLVHARSLYVKESYKNWKDAHSALANYYKLFPVFSVTNVKKQWNSLPCNVYKSLIETNAEVLCVFASPDKKGDPITIKWHQLIAADPAEQVHYWDETRNRSIIHPILQAMGMKITPASSGIMQCFNIVFTKQEKLKTPSNSLAMCDEAAIDAAITEPPSEYPLTRIPPISPDTVFKYYTELSQTSSENVFEQCLISESIFKDVETFLTLIKYLLGLSIKPQKSETKEEPLKLSVASQVFLHDKQISGSVSNAISSPSSSPSLKETLVSHSGSTATGAGLDGTYHSFPHSPFSHFLLLTADGNLRRFEKENKVLNSKFSDLFPRHLDKFLHPILQEIKFTKSYFIQPDDDQEKNSQFIDSILSGTFPSNMRRKIVTRCDNVISKTDLQNYWKCFEENKVFSRHLLTFLKHWALLLTTDNRLFSTGEGVLPAYLPDNRPDSFSENPDPTVEKVYTIMKSLQMPFLDKSVVKFEVSDCPLLTNRECILTNFFHVNSDSLLTKSLDSESINNLILYFSKNSKPGDSKWLNQIQSLPFFLDVANQFQSILYSKAFLWPSYCCESGYSKWVRDSGTTFIQRRGLWTRLGSAEQLNLHTISDVKVYTSYIFPRFNLLSEDERYEHLDHIKCFIYPTAKGYSQSKVMKYTSEEECQKISESINFIDALKTVKCIGSLNDLKPISSFCDHTVTIFRVFSSDFQSLPKQLQSKIWLDFFKELGLKVVLEQSEYRDLCNKVAYARMDNVEQCATTLLEYLFSHDILTMWYYDTYFLKQISEIPFVPTADISSVSWLVPGAAREQEMVKLNGAASESLKTVLWTVRPVVRLPEDCLTYIQMKNGLAIRMLTSMNVIFQATSNDVVANVKRISYLSRQYSDSTLFRNYPAKLLPPPKKALSILDILMANFKFLNQHTDRNILEHAKSQVVPAPASISSWYEENVKDNSVSTLESVPCIPVYSDPMVPENMNEKFVLVEPSCVIDKTDDAVQFYPYLHTLPTKLKACLPLMQDIGVKSSLELSHIQIVLQKIYNATTVDPVNTKMSVKRALTSLQSLLRAVNESLTKDAISSSLSPLYLPNSNHSLKLSTDMIYGDISCYFGDMDINLASTNLSLFSVTKEDYGVDTTVLCHLLPEKVRPKKMSEKCEQLLAEDCSLTDHSETTRKIEAMVNCKGNSSVVAEFFSKFLPNEADEDALKEALATFFSSLNVVAVSELKTQIRLRDSKKVIALHESDYFIKANTFKSVLYIDSNFDDDDEVVDEIVQSLHATISTKLFPANGLPFEQNADLFKAIKKYIKADTPTKKANVLKKYRVGVEVKRSSKLALGYEIPLDHQFLLDQDLNNTFTPMEYVGYEDREGHIIVAQVLNLVETAEEADSLHRVYSIIISCQPNAEGKEVSAIDLYKLVTTKGPLRGQVPVSEGSDGSIDKIKERVYKELREIWKLDWKQRRKAIKRLYLRWHPDKNLDNQTIAKKVFTYLKKEIELLEKQPPSQSQPQPSSDLLPRTAHSSPQNRSFQFYEWKFTATEHESSKTKASRQSPSSAYASPEEGRRWLRQAEVDFVVLCGMFNRLQDISNPYAHICFLAHQVAEKALKGGVYALCGMDSQGLVEHDLYRHASRLETTCQNTVVAKGIASLALQLDHYYMTPRYPNRCAPPKIPSDHFDKAEAAQAKENCEALLEIVKSIMPP